MFSTDAPALVQVTPGKRPRPDSDLDLKDPGQEPVLEPEEPAQSALIAQLQRDMKILTVNHLALHDRQKFLENFVMKRQEQNVDQVMEENRMLRAQVQQLTAELDGLRRNPPSPAPMPTFTYKVSPPTTSDSPPVSSDMERPFTLAAGKKKNKAKKEKAPAPPAPTGGASETKPSTSTSQTAAAPPAKKPSYAAVAASKRETAFKKLLRNKDMQPMEKSDALLRKPPSEEDIQDIDYAMISLPLRSSARENPKPAWTMVMEAHCGEEPLLISFLNPGKAEIFFDRRKRDKFINHLPPQAKMHNDSLSERDIKRRARAYLDGFIKPLRLAALDGFTPDQKFEVLLTADLMLESRFKDSKEKEKLRMWRNHIRKDRAALEESQKAANQTALEEEINSMLMAEEDEDL
jgi:hypothetical protein